MTVPTLVPLPAPRSYRHVAAAVFGTPWAIDPAKLMALVEILQVRLDGFRFSAEEIAGRLDAAAPRRPVQHSTGVTGVIPVIGVLSKRANMFTEASGGTSIDDVTRAFRAALNDDRIKSIVFDIDSPGGSTDGVQELADEIYEARGRKPITAVANPLAASAAYWIGAAASEFAITPSGMAGSIGVYAVHHDESALDEALGIRHTVVSAGKYKAEGVYQPLSSEAIQHLQNMVDEMYGHFVDSVARGRGVSAADVRDGFGEGRVVLAREAVRQGMVDRIATLDTVLARHGGRETQIAAVGSAALTEMSAEERHRYDRLLTWRLEQHRDNRDLAAPISPDGGNQ